MKKRTRETFYAKKLNNHVLTKLTTKTSGIKTLSLKKKCNKINRILTNTNKKIFFRKKQLMSLLSLTFINMRSMLSSSD